MRKTVRLAGVPRPRLRVVGGFPNSGRHVRWLINGYPAVLTVWTDQEWDRLEFRPNDARKVDGGLWCALRME